MLVFEPLAILAAVAALIAAHFWFKVVRAIDGGNARSNTDLRLAATGTMITLTLAGAAVLANPVADLLLGLMA